MKNPIIDGVIKPNNRTDILKLLAIISMFIDHIGYVFFPQYIIFRLLGRIAFPIFAYHISIGYINTSNLKKYAIRLFLFGLISQLPYNILFQNGSLNIFFTLFLGLICIYALDKRNYIILALTFIAAFILDFEYGFYGILTILSFYFYRENHKNAITMIIFLNLIYFLNHNFSIQVFSLSALLLIYKEWDVKVRLNKYIYYCFYPLHISILYIINIFLNIK